MRVWRRRLDREQVLRALTFWLRPAFALRVLHRVQTIAGFDRAIALASSALTAGIPLLVVGGAVLSRLGAGDAADRIIDRYELSGGGADAVRDVFAPAGKVLDELRSRWTGARTRIDGRPGRKRRRQP